MADHGNCQHLLASLSAYLDEEVSAGLCAEIEQHMGECEKCRVVVDTLRQTVDLYRTLPQPALSEGARKRLYCSLDLEPYLQK